MLMQAQSDEERETIEEKMSSDAELSQYLHALQETDREDLVMEERARRQAKRQSRVDADLEAMDVDDEDGGVGQTYVQGSRNPLARSPRRMLMMLGLVESQELLVRWATNVFFRADNFWMPEYHKYYQRPLNLP